MHQIIPQCTIFEEKCTRAHFCDKMVHCEMRDWCIVRYRTGALWDIGLAHCGFCAGLVGFSCCLLGDTHKRSEQHYHLPLMMHDGNSRPACQSWTAWKATNGMAMWSISWWEHKDDNDIDHIYAPWELYSCHLLPVWCDYNFPGNHQNIFSIAFL